jgi:soluble P-type ATPase
MYVPTGDQMVAVTLSHSDVFDEVEQFEVLRDLWLDLFVNSADRLHFVKEMALRRLDATALSKGIAILTGRADQLDEADEAEPAQ